MAVIPPDAGVCLKLPTDTGLPAGPNRLAEISPDVPDLPPGKVFTARIQEILPEGTYRALVAGRQLTLSLLEGAKAGDTLELVVIDRSPKAIIARLANSPAGSEAQARYPHTTLSPTAQLIGRLLAEQPAQPAATLNRGAPLLPAPPNTGSNTAVPQLATALSNAVSQSGLFYESHQSQWVAGQRPVHSLLTEPQGRYSPQNSPGFVPPQSTLGTLPEATQRQTAETAPQTQSAAQNARGSVAEALLGNDRAGNTANPAHSSAAPQASTQHAQIPDDLRPLVQQQLEAAANQRLVWHGEAWPGQHMHWQIEEDAYTPRTEDELPLWNTTLKLTTPRLGQVEARLQLSGNQVRITLNTPFGSTAADLQDELPALTQAFDLAGLDLAQAQVRHVEEMSEEINEQMNENGEPEEL